MLMIPLYLLCNPQELRLQYPGTANSARLVSGLTWGMKFNANKTKPKRVSRSRTINTSKSPPLTIGGTVLKECDDLYILGVTSDSKMTNEKHLRSVSWAASQRVGIMRKYWRVFHDTSLLGRCIWGLSCPFWSSVLQCGARLQIHTLN